MRLVKPDLSTPMIGDADREDLTTSRADSSAYEGMNLSFFPDDLNELRAYFRLMARLTGRKDFLWFASQRKEGCPPAELDSNLREGIYVMRSGFNPKDSYLLVHDYLFASSVSGLQNWVYFVYGDTRVLLSEAELLKDISVLVLALCVLLGFLVVVSLIRRSYLQVDDVMKRFDDQPFSGRGNEFTYIGDSITRLQSEKKEQSRLLHDRLLTSLVDIPESTRLPDRHDLEEAGILFPSPIFFVMTSTVKEKYDRLIGQGLFPIKRWGVPEDVADAVSVFASDAFLYTTGNYIDIDGGFHLQSL